MFNHPLIHEEAKLKVEQRKQEAETYRWHKQLGYSDRRTARWVFVFIILFAALMIFLLL